MSQHISSRYRGVHYSQAKNCRLNPWLTSIMVEGRRIALGGYSSEEEAAWIYNLAAKAYGQTDRLNELKGRPPKPEKPVKTSLTYFNKMKRKAKLIETLKALKAKRKKKS